MMMVVIMVVMIVKMVMVMMVMILMAGGYADCGKGTCSADDDVGDDGSGIMLW